VIVLSRDINMYHVISGHAWSVTWYPRDRGQLPDGKFKFGGN